SGFGEGRPFFTTESHGGPRRKELDRGLGDSSVRQPRARFLPSVCARWSCPEDRTGQFLAAQHQSLRRANVLSIRRFFAAILRPLRVNSLLRGSPWCSVVKSTRRLRGLPRAAANPHDFLKTHEKRIASEVVSGKSVVLH